MDVANIAMKVHACLINNQICTAAKVLRRLLLGQSWVPEYGLRASTSPPVLEKKYSILAVPYWFLRQHVKSSVVILREPPSVLPSEINTSEVFPRLWLASANTLVEY